MNLSPRSRAFAFAVVLLLGAPLAGLAADAISADARERIATLRAEVAHHDDLYFRHATPEISDFTYDELKRELAELERAHPEATADRPTAASPSGDDRTGAFPTAPHRVRMLSLDKTYAESELRAWHAKLAQQVGRDDLAYVVEPKVDGLAISVTFENGRLVRAVTRGDGIEGDDITANVTTISGLRHELRPRTTEGAANPIPDRVELRGEIFLTWAGFERINQERTDAGEPLFANPRNAAAGSAKLTDPGAAAARPLAIVFYGWGACEPATMLPPTQRSFIAQLRAWGLPALDEVALVHSADELATAVERFEHQRRMLAFPTDGAVVKLDAVALRADLGETDVAPRWAIAFKYPPDRAETQVLAITIQVGRTGALTPVAEFAPVVLGGATVTRASLHNRAALTRHDVRVGDFVFVEKAGEIIPAIVGVIHARRPASSQPFVFPETCPACGTAVVSDPKDAAARCPNAACPAQVRRRIEHFASRSCVDIEGLGPALVDRLVTRGAVRNAADLYRLDREQLLTLGGDVTVSTDQLLAAIARSQHAELWRFIHGLGIPGVGESTAKDFARRFRDLRALAAARAEDFADEGRSATAIAVLAYFGEPGNRELVAGLLEAGVAPAAPTLSPITNPRVHGKNFVLTGRLPRLTREEATRWIEAGGGRVSENVGPKTDYVIAGEDPGAKLTRARSLGVPVIDEVELRRLLDEAPSP